MKILSVLLFLTFCCVEMNAQEWGVSLNLSVRKNFEIGKHSTIGLRQQVQLVPEFKKNQHNFGDFFLEDGFWPLPDYAKRLDDDDDMPQTPSPELDDSPVKIKLDKRSTTAVQHTFAPAKWLRHTTGYGLTHDGVKPRHTLRAELDYRPLKHFKGKRKIDLAVRTLFQHIGAEHRKKKEMRWESNLVPRLDCIWSFKKDHGLTWSNALNGAWDDGALKFDRWRSNLSLSYTYKKQNRFILGLQYQQRLKKKKSSKGFSLGYEFRF